MTRTEEKRLRAFAATLRGSGLDMRARELEEILPSRTRRVSSPPRSPGKSKEERRQERDKRWQAIRVAVYERAQGTCEVCHEQSVDDAHHVISGPERRVYESKFTVLATCRRCHDRMHDGDLDTLQAVALIPWLASQAYRHLMRRMAKIAAVRNGRAA